MKKILFTTLMITFLFNNAMAGGMREIPIQLLKVDNLGRIQFLGNALAATGLTVNHGVRYKDLSSTIIGGDEEDSDFTGGYFYYQVQLEARGRFKYKCSQNLSVGNFRPELTKPVECQLLN